MKAMEDDTFDNLVQIWSDIDNTDWANVAFRKRIIATVGSLLPDGFTGPTRAIGQNDVVWVSELLTVTLYSMDARGGTRSNPYREGNYQQFSIWGNKRGLRDFVVNFAQFIFDSLAAQGYDLTQKDKDADGIFKPYIPSSPDP